MTATLVDTTSLLELWVAQGQQAEIRQSANYLKNPGEETYFLNYAKRITPALEAIVLFDNVIADKRSFDRNKALYNVPREFENIFDFVNCSEDDERDVYKIAGDQLHKIFSNSDVKFIDFMRRHINESDYRDVQMAIPTSSYIPRLPPSTYFDDIIDFVGDSEREFLNRAKKLFIHNTLFSGAAAVNIMRTLYYMTTQQIMKCHLSLHPIRANMFCFEPYETMGAFGTSQLHPGSSIVKFFDESVRRAYGERQKKWLGKEDIAISVPLLSLYVIRRVMRGENPLECIRQLRDSREAVGYREEVSSLSNSIAQGDLVSADRILSRLDDAQKGWSESLGYDPMKYKHNISLSVPVFGGLGTEVPVRMRKFYEEPGDKILIFLHRLFTGSQIGHKGK